MKSPIKLKRILLTLFFAIGVVGASVAGPYDNWPDDAVCMWLEMEPTHEGYIAEVQKRGIGCEGGKAVAGSAKTKATTKSTSTTKKTSTTKSKASTANSDITIYEVVFPATVLKKLLDRVVSKLDYDFSKHKLANNAHDFSCSFRIQKVDYNNSELGELEHWNLAQGTINIQDSNVEFVNSRWMMGGLSTDPSYFRDEVNIKLTEDGHLVGKMAYFPIGIKQGEVPENPDYPTLTKHKRSKPINLKSIEDSAEFWIDVRDWAGGVMFVSNCK